MGHSISHSFAIIEMLAIIKIELQHLKNLLSTDAANMSQLGKIPRQYYAQMWRLNELIAWQCKKLALRES